MRFILALIIILFSLPASANEGAGLLLSDLNGALPKALWQNQPRSEIATLLQNLPADAPLRSIQKIKQNLLLSQYDVKTIKNDVEPSHENNLLTIRLEKLIEIGLWEDAFRLYTATINDPQDNNELAQVSVLLSLLEKGLATACLEEKSLDNRFDSPVFWQRISDICDIEIGSALTSTADFAESQTLQNIYKDKNFKLSANNTSELSALTTLELALLSTKGRIDYKNTQLTRKTPPRIIKTFMMDERFPAAKRPTLDKIARQQAILPSLPPQNTNTDSEITSQENLIRIIVRKLKNNQKISEQEYKKLRQLAPNNSENYFYLSYMSMIQPNKTMEKLPSEDILLGIEALSIKTGKKAAFLKSLLDKAPEFSNNPATVYEKRSHTGLDGDIIAKRNKIDWLEKTVKNNKAGLSLLIMLSNIENSAWENSSVDMSEEKTFNMLKNLSKVGLIDQAHQIAKERLANLMMLK